MAKEEEQPQGSAFNAIAEPALTAFTGAVAAPVSGIGGLLELLASRDPAAAAEAVRRIGEDLTYEPRTVEGNAGLAGLGAVFQPVNEVIEAPGKYVGNTSPMAGAAVTSLLSGALPFKRVTAYHGSPHTFDKFDLSKIGTGEGNQAYGQGHYLSEAREIAEHYRAALGGSELLVNGQPVPNAHIEARNMLRAHGNLTNALDELENYTIPNRHKLIDSIPIVSQRKALNEELIKLYDARDYLLKLKNSGATVEVKPTGRLYTAEVPHPEHLLDLDAPINRQPPAVREALHKAGFTEYVDEMTDAYLKSLPDDAARAQAKKMIAMKPEQLVGTPQADARWRKINSLAPDIDHNIIHDIVDWYDSKSGSDLYTSLGGYRDPERAAEASKRLHEAGVPGLTYVGGSSGERNFVVFHDDDIDIKNREAHGGLVRYARGGRVTMPSHSPLQARFMQAIAHGWKPSHLRNPPSRAVARDFVRADQKQMALGGQVGGLAAMAPTFKRVIGNVKKATQAGEPTILAPAAGAPDALPLSPDHGAPGSITRMLWDKYGIVDPTATAYDARPPQANRDITNMVINGPTTAPAAPGASMPQPGPMPGVQAPNPYAAQLASHQSRISDILAGVRGKALGGVVRMAGGGPVPVGMAPPDSLQGGLAMAGSYGGAPMPPTGMAPTPGSNPFMAGPVKPPGGPPMGMTPPDQARDPMAVALAQPRPGLPSSMTGTLQALRMANRDGGGRPGVRIGLGDQQGGLARAMQTQTGRPPISRRMAFPGTR